MRTYVVKIVPARAPDVSRTVELTEAQTLGDLHAVIQSAFRLDDDHIYAFFLSNRPWDHATEYADPRGARPNQRRADRTKLRALDLVAGKQFLYVFDFGDELWHQLEVLSTGSSESGVRYPRAIESVGEAPPQYPDPDASDEPIELGDLEPVVATLDEVIAAGDALDEKTETWLREAHAAAMVLHAALGEDGDRLRLVERALGWDVFGWLLELPFALARGGLVDEAAEVGQRFGAIVDAETFLADRAVILAQAGRRDEALAQVESNVARMNESIWVVLKAGDVHRALGDDARAEQLYRRAYDAEGAGERARDAAFERLERVLEGQGRRDELANMRAAEAAKGRAAMDARWRRLTGVAEPVRREAPKVGRNDPCPCGSGKKHKKCCAA